MRDIRVIMSKKRTLASKRRQRLKQKKKKRFLKKQTQPHNILKASSDHPGWANMQENFTLDSEDEYDSFGSPGSPPPTPSDILSSPPHEASEINGEEMVSEVKCLQEKCKSYKILMAKKDESEHILRKKLQDQQLEMEEVVSEAKRKIDSVRTFWRDQIFREQSRSGIIIERAVCKKKCI